MTKHRVTIADVAAKSGVSKMTVSRVINNKGEISEATRKRVQETMDQLGYRPNRIARSLAMDKTLRIGIVVPSLSNPYFGAILEGMEAVLWENDYHILLCNTGGNPDREQAVMNLFEDHNVDGVFVISAHSPIEKINRCLRNQHASVVMNTPVSAEIAGRIYTNEIRSLSLAVNHLLENGRIHLGYVGFNISTYARFERSRGFEVALRNAGLPLDSRTQIANIPNTESGISQGLQRLLQTFPRIDGLICYNDGIAARALHVCAQLGLRVPDDVAVIGFDDIFLSDLITPPLTTLDLKITKQEVGALAAHMLLERIANDEIHQDDVILDHQLIIRGSAP